MGLFDFIKRAGSGVFKAITRPVRNALSSVRRAVKTVVSPIDAVNEGMKKLVSKLTNHPTFGKLARQGLEKIRNDPVLGRVFRGLQSYSEGVDALEEFGRGDDRLAKQKLREAVDKAPAEIRDVLRTVANTV